MRSQRVAVGGYTVRPRGCGGIGRRARFRSVWAKARGGSSPLIRISETSGGFSQLGAVPLGAAPCGEKTRPDRDRTSPRRGSALAGEDPGDVLDRAAHVV